MTYKQGLKLKAGDKFKHKVFTGIYEVQEIQVLPKSILLKCNDGHTYTHKDIQELIISTAN